MTVTATPASNKDEFRQSMIQFIRTHFADVVESDLALLEEAEGLERLCELYLDRRADRAA